jgi:hypothetical protein
MFDCWLIETDEMARRGRPLLALFSREFLKRPRGIMERLVATGYARLSRIIHECALFGVKSGCDAHAEGV